MTYHGSLSQAQKNVLWLSASVCAAFAVVLLSGLGAAQAENHPMQKHGYFVDSENLYVPPKPDRLPALVPGQQFLCIPDAERSWDYFDAASGRRLKRSDLALKILTLVGIEEKAGRKRTLRFLLEGTGRHVLLFTREQAVTKLPGIQPLVQDDTLRRLQKKYVGKKVWAYGNGNFQAVGVTKQPNRQASYNLDNSQAIRIKRLVRVFGEQHFGDLGSAEVGMSDSNSLVAVLDLPRKFHYEAASFDGPPRFTAQGEASPYSVCLGFLSDHVDDWDFERTFSLVNLHRLHPHWPQKVRRGMTPEMVAWARGWPQEYGTKAQLEKESEWVYPSEFLSTYLVYFKNGKVVNYETKGIH